LILVGKRLKNIITKRHEKRGRFLVLFCFAVPHRIEYLGDFTSTGATNQDCGCFSRRSHRRYSGAFRGSYQSILAPPSFFCPYFGLNRRLVCGLWPNSPRPTISLNRERMGRGLALACLPHTITPTAIHLFARIHLPEFFLLARFSSCFIDRAFPLFLLLRGISGNPLCR